MATSVPDVLAATLSELGLPAAINMIQTLLMLRRLGIRYGDGYAVVLGGNIDFL